MENKEIIIEIPDGYEIDKENSTFEKIKLRPIIKDIRTWEDLKSIEGYYIDNFSKFCNINHTSVMSAEDKNIYCTKKHAKSALAMAQISQLMPHYGGEITDEEWNNQSMPKFVLYRSDNSIKNDTMWSTYKFLAFHTKEQRDNFLKYNGRLVRDYFMLD